MMESVMVEKESDMQECPPQGSPVIVRHALYALIVRHVLV
jgi:hypothetical protein